MSKLIKYVKKMPDKSGYLMILPFFIIYLYFWITPIFNVVADSFTDYQLFGGKHFVGLGNYIQLMKDVTFIKALEYCTIYHRNGFPHDGYRFSGRPINEFINCPDKNFPYNHVCAPCPIHGGSFHDMASDL